MKEGSSSIVLWGYFAEGLVRFTKKTAQQGNTIIMHNISIFLEMTQDVKIGPKWVLTPGTPHLLPKLGQNPNNVKDFQEPSQ